MFVSRQTYQIIVVDKNIPFTKVMIKLLQNKSVLALLTECRRVGQTGKQMVEAPVNQNEVCNQVIVFK